MMDEINPGQPFLWVNILRRREIFRMIETPGSNVDLIGAFVVLIGQRRSTATAKRPQRSRLGPISAWRSFHKLELRTFYGDPRHCLRPGGSPAVSTMTIRSNSDLGRRAETHLATITATGNLILFHATHCKFGMSDRNREDVLVGKNIERDGKIWVLRTPYFFGMLYSSTAYCAGAFEARPDLGPFAQRSTLSRALQKEKQAAALKGEVTTNGHE
jgi:hypothetical protein